VTALRASTHRELAAVMAGGHRFDPDAAAGWVYRGTSLGLPALVEKLSWVKFAKAFHRDGASVRGWNIRIEQDPLDRPWRPKLRRGAPITFGAFELIEDRAGIVLDYGGERGVLRVLRDPLVALDDRADVLFGRSFVAVGGRTVPTPSYFLLERDTPLANVRPRPGA
ncbi:MAG TPA: hypothetical protein VFQ65_00580, partial [Kofleriaceae bacterium]|nr:hypothetical protein [Kofleriaceae bacterium]